MMKLPSHIAMLSARTNQMGAASVAIAMLMMFILVAAVLAIQNMSGSSAVDSQKSEEQVAALFLAESGLERAKGLLDAPGSFTNTKCTDIAIGGALSLGRGTFSSNAVSCDNSAVCGGNCSSGTCGSCTVTVTGTIGSSNRTITRVFTLKQNTGGTFCNTANPLTPNCTNSATLLIPPADPTWKSSVTNTSGSPAIALFNLAAARQGSWSSATCFPTGCEVVWTIDAQNSTSSVSSMGNAIPLGIGASAEVFQTLNLNRSVVENGALFPGSSTLPGVRGTYSYWDDTNPSGGGTKTVGKSGDLLGQTNNGTATSSTAGCLQDTSVTSNSQQACTSWCSGADTLVIGLAASATSVTDQFNSVTFNTGGTNPQNIPMLPIGGRFPTATTTGAPPNIFAELRYAHNPSFTSAADVKSGAVVTGKAETTITGWIAGNSKVLHVTGEATGGALEVGAVVVSGLDAGTTVTNLNGLNGIQTGDYEVSKQCNSCDHGIPTPVTIVFPSRILTVTAVAGQPLAETDSIFVPLATAKSATISSLGAGTTGAAGTYNLDTLIHLATGSTVLSDGRMLSTATNLPASAMSSLLYVVVSAGQGKVTGGTTVPIASSITSLNGVLLSARPKIPLSLATLKGGTFAFFDQGAATTNFSLTKTGGAEYWAAGFVCLSGVTQTPTETTSGPQKATGSTWHEVVK